MKKPDHVGLELALDHWLWSGSTDRELAEEYGCSLAYVRERRRVRREDVLLPEVRRHALELAELAGWDGATVVDVVLLSLRTLKIGLLALRSAKSSAAARAALELVQTRKEWRAS
jgi:hypothetical protein